MQSPATLLSLAERDLELARATAGTQRDAQLDACRERLNNLPAHVHTARQASVLRDLAVEYYSKGDRATAALAPIAKAVLLLRAEKDDAGLRRCLSIQCMVLSQNGDFSGAIEAGAESLNLAQQLEDTAAQLAAWMNLGVTFYETGLTGEARACMTKVLGIVEQTGDDAFGSRTRALHMFGLCCWRENDARGALEYASQAIGAWENVDAISDQVRSLAEALAARYCLRLNERELARRHVEVALSHATRSGSERALVVAEIALGLVEVHEDQAETGSARILGCVERGRHVGRDTHNGALLALVEAYERLGQPDKALKALRQMMSIQYGLQRDAALSQSYRALVAGQAPEPGVSVQHAPSLEATAARVRSILERRRASA